MTINSCAQLSDRELLDHATRAAVAQRGAVVNLLILLGEIDARRLFLPEGCSSLFTYCTQVLRFSEHEAYHRIEAARVARAFPIVLDELGAGTLTLSSITILRPHLRVDNADALITNARHKSKREVEQQMAALAPRPDAKSIIRECRHSEPGGDPAAIIERALTLLVEDLERRRLARVKTPRITSGGTGKSLEASSRHIPAAVRREVWARDAGRCAFAGRQGRCRETGHLEFHHVDAFALGGEATVANLELRCRAHNQYEGKLLFGSR